MIKKGDSVIDNVMKDIPIKSLQKRVLAAHCWRDRVEIETKEYWESWISHIPALNFKYEWKVQVIPPYSGVLVRFHVYDKHDNMVSVFLDGYNRLNFSEHGPYWEISPWEDSNQPDEDSLYYKMNDTKGLMEGIQMALDFQQKRKINEESE